MWLRYSKRHIWLTSFCLLSSRWALLYFCRYLRCIICNFFSPNNHSKDVMCCHYLRVVSRYLRNDHPAAAPNTENIGAAWYRGGSEGEESLRSNEIRRNLNSGKKHPMGCFPLRGRIGLTEESSRHFSTSRCPPAARCSKSHPAAVAYHPHATLPFVANSTYDTSTRCLKIIRSSFWALEEYVAADIHTHSHLLSLCRLLTLYALFFRSESLA